MSIINRLFNVFVSRPQAPLPTPQSSTALSTPPSSFTEAPDNQIDEDTFNRADANTFEPEPVLFLMDEDIDELESELPAEEETQSEGRLDTIDAEQITQQHPYQQFLEQLCQDSRQGKLENIQSHLSDGLNPNVQNPQDSNRTPLMHASDAGQVPVVKKFLENGAHPAIVNDFNSTALHYAASSGHPKVTEQLILNGAPVNHPNAFGQTPLMYATESNHLDTMSLLLATGANVNFRNQYGKTALIDAAANGSIAAATTLLDSGANINAKTSTRTTALMIAAREGHLDMVKFLLSRGALASLTDEKEITAQRWAQHRHHFEIADILGQAMQREKAEAAQHLSKVVRGFHPRKPQN